MAATDPYLVTDLIKKYGWVVMPYLSNLGISLLSEAQVLFVDSGHADTLDADDTYHGHTIDKPLATIDFAIGLCTADQGDVILVAPGHTETISAANGIDLDVDDVTIIGLGLKDKRPKITLSAQASTFEINADNVTVKNLQFVGSKTGGVTVCIDVKTGSDYVSIEGCHFYETANTLELLTVISLEDQTDYFTCKDCVFTNLSGGDNLSAIFTEADEHDFLVIDNCVFQGDWTNAVIDIDAGDINYPLIKDSIIINYDTTTGDAIDLASATQLVMVNLRIASGDPNAYPVADISAAFQMGCHACEVAKETVALLGGASATAWSS